MPEVHPHDQKWLKEQLNCFPPDCWAAILSDYQAVDTRRNANLMILSDKKAMENILDSNPLSKQVNFNTLDYKDDATYHLRQVYLIHAELNERDLGKRYLAISAYLKSQNIAPHPISQTIEKSVKNGTLTPQEKLKVQGVINRSMDEKWWQKKLKIKYRRQHETLARYFNQVSRNRGIYLSDTGLRQIQQNWRDNQKLLERARIQLPSAPLAKLGNLT